VKNWAWFVLIFCGTAFVASALVNAGALLGLHAGLLTASYWLLLALFPSVFAAGIYFHWLIIRLGYLVAMRYALYKLSSLTRWIQAILFLYMVLWLAKSQRRGPDVAVPTPELLSSVAMLFYFYIGSTLYAVRPGTDAWRKW
jgi:hypothetical protein